MIQKLFAVGILSLLTIAAAYAQKPVISAVTDIEDDPSNGMEMCRSLFNEYFLSELTTHAKVNMLDTKTVQTAISDLKIPRGKKLNTQQIIDLCKKLNVDAICLVFMKREKNTKILVDVRILCKTGKLLGNVSATMEGVGDTDSVSSKIARDCAVILRKINGSALLGNELDNSTNNFYDALPSTVTSICEPVK